MSDRPAPIRTARLELVAATLAHLDAGMESTTRLGRLLDDGGRMLVGAGGYFGPPGSDGGVEVGYSTAPEFERRAFAKEMVEALVSRALGSAGVRRVIAHVQVANAGSRKVLERCGFRPAGAGRDPGTMRYERTD